MNVQRSRPRLVLGVTGASGAVYAHRLINVLVEAGAEVNVIISPHGRQLFLDEMAIREVDSAALIGRDDERLVIYGYRDIGASIASGSTHTDGMIICPCSANTLAQTAAGMGNNLITRAAQVTLKERRRLILVPREAPFSHLDIENCLRLSTAGAIICPASPGFYMMPQSVDDIVNFMVGKFMDLLGVPHSLATRWEEKLDADTRAAKKV